MGNQWYYIAFMKVDTGALYELFEKEGFNHVVLFYPDPFNDNYFHTIQHMKTFVAYGMVERDSFEAYVDGAIVLRVKSKRTYRAKWWWWIPTPDTCVTIAKEILGIQKPFIWTPYQLYKHIQKVHKWDSLKR